MSWWDFGEHSGYQGTDLALYKVQCAFCDESGNFETVHHVERAQPSKPDKVLNYDTLKCGYCGNLLMVFWSASAGFGSRLHNFKTLPWPTSTTRHPDHWPADIGRYWMQAHRSLEAKNWDAAAVMARSAVQLIARKLEAKGANLKQEIDDLAGNGLLPPVMREWSHEIRELGNDGAHPSAGSTGTAQKDAQDVVEFLDVLLSFTENLPHRIKEYRDRKR